MTPEKEAKSKGTACACGNTGAALPERMTRKEAVRILEELNRIYPHTKDEKNFLKFDGPYQILIMTILSAQTTDATVNGLKDELFRAYPTPAALAAADQAAVERIIHSAGFYHSKAKNIINTSKRLCGTYDGDVPRDMKELITLPGVGRKTANIVLEHAFGITAGIAVDTHVGRLSRKIGFTENTDPEKAEKDLMALFPKKWWGEINYLLIRHGREICQARKPDCSNCIIRNQCRNG